MAILDITLRRLLFIDLISLQNIQKPFNTGHYWAIYTKIYSII